VGGEAILPDIFPQGQGRQPGQPRAFFRLNVLMRNTAYLDKSGDTRMMLFSEHSFPMSEFVRMKVGPVIMTDELAYFREVNFLDNR
jgi:hypothetical protein